MRLRAKIQPVTRVSQVWKEGDVPDSDQTLALLGSEVKEKLDDSEGLGALVPISTLSDV